MSTAKLVTCAIYCFGLQLLVDYLLSFFSFFDTPQHSGSRVSSCNHASASGRQRPFLSVTVPVLSVISPAPLLPGCLLVDNWCAITSPCNCACACAVVRCSGAVEEVRPWFWPQWAVPTCRPPQVPPSLKSHRAQVSQTRT